MRRSSSSAARRHAAAPCRKCGTLHGSDRGADGRPSRADGLCSRCLTWLVRADLCMWRDVDVPPGRMPGDPTESEIRAAAGRIREEAAR